MTTSLFLSLAEGGALSSESTVIRREAQLLAGKPQSVLNKVKIRTIHSKYGENSVHEAERKSESAPTPPSLNSIHYSDHHRGHTFRIDVAGPPATRGIVPPPPGESLR